MDALVGDVNAIDWFLATENIDTDLRFTVFLQLFHRVLDKHAMLKKTTKRKKTENQTMVYKRYNKIYKKRQIIQRIYLSKIFQEHECKYSAFKKHHNKIIGILNMSRQSHYQNYFNENKKNEEPYD